MSFQELVGQVVDFYGVDGTCFKVGNQVFEAVEDESDGYRSMMEEVYERTDWEQSNLNFFRRPVGRVRVEDVDENLFDGYQLVEVGDGAYGGHIWLRFGTDNTDDYYPSFIFTYEPMQPILEREIETKVVDRFDLLESDAEQKARREKGFSGRDRFLMLEAK